MTTGLNCKKNGFILKNVQPQIERVIRNGKMYETQKLDGKIVRTSVFVDLNNDGEFTNNEITQVQQYYYREDGTLKSRITYKDNDHDGYSDDTYIVDKYNEYGDLDRVAFKKNTSIKELKQKAETGTCCDKAALGNREMVAHKDGQDWHICYHS